MKLFKAIFVVLLIAVVGVVFYNGAFNATFEAALPLGMFRYLEEAPSDEIANKAKYKMDTFDGGFASKTTDLEKALYLFAIATFNEQWLGSYAYLINASGSADYAGLNGGLISNSAHIRNDEENFEYHRWINALNDEGSDSSLGAIKGIVNAILSKASENIDYKDTNYYRVAKQGDTAYDKVLKMNTAKWRKVTTSPRSEKKELKVVETIAEAYSKDYDSETYATYGYKNYVDFYRLNEKGVKAVKEVSVELKVDALSGKQYYDVKMIGDIEVLNNNAETMERVVANNAPASAISFRKYELHGQIWKDSGLFRSWSSIEDWHGALDLGTFGKLSAATQMQQPTKYSYHPEDIKPAGYLEGFGIVV